MNEVKILEKQKIELELRLHQLKKDGKASRDELNELKSEILFVSKKLQKIIGKNELERREKLRSKKYNLDQINIDNFLFFKSKYRKISNFKLSIARLLNEINNSYTEDNSLSKVRK